VAKDIAKHWNGKIYGTNTGNVFLKFEQAGKNLSANLRFMDDLYGMAIYSMKGKIESEKIVLNGSPCEDVEGLELGEITIEGALDNSGNISGEWYSKLGTAGTFKVFPHEMNSIKTLPEQIHNKTSQIGAIRLYKSDLEQLINFIEKDFGEGKTVVTYEERGCELTKYVSEFLKESTDVKEFSYLKLILQEPEAHGINRVVVIELKKKNASEVTVSGINESWVVGKAEGIARLLKPRENKLVTLYRRYGLNINAFLFTVMLVVIPEFSGWKERALFIGSTYSILTILFIIYNKYIPNTEINLQERKHGFLSRAWPTALAWLVAVSSSVASAYIFYVLKSSN